MFIFCNYSTWLQCSFNLVQKRVFSKVFIIANSVNEKTSKSAYWQKNNSLKTLKISPKKVLLGTLR